MRSDRLFDASELIVHEMTPEQRRRAVLAVAGRACDATDLATLLAMLGLDPTERRPVDERTVEPEPAVPATALPPKFMAELAALVAHARARSVHTGR